MKNKENTKRKLLDAVGNIIRTEGFTGLGVNKVAKAAKVSKILIYRYFGSFTELLYTYIRENDFWKNYLSDNAVENGFDLSVREQVCRILAEQFNNFYNHCEMEALLVSEIARANGMVKNLVRGESIASTAPYCDVVSTLLLAGTDHLILKEQDNNNADQTESSLMRKTDLMQSIGQIVDWSLG